jgi:hypothetical protein
MSRCTQLTYNIVCFSTKFFALNLDLFFSVINLNNSYNKNFVLKHTILYIHCVDLLMWSPTKLDFLFYDFSVFYYDFSKIQTK